MPSTRRRARQRRWCRPDCATRRRGACAKPPGGAVVRRRPGAGAARWYGTLHRRRLLAERLRRHAAGARPPSPPRRAGRSAPAADLTAHVLRRAGHGSARRWGPRLGFGAERRLPRRPRPCRSCSADRPRQPRAGRGDRDVRRRRPTRGNGSLFKVLALAGTRLPRLPASRRKASLDHAQRLDGDGIRHGFFTRRGGVSSTARSRASTAACRARISRQRAGEPPPRRRRGARRRSGPPPTRCTAPSVDVTDRLAGPNGPRADAMVTGGTASRSASSPATAPRCCSPIRRRGDRRRPCRLARRLGRRAGGNARGHDGLGAAPERVTAAVGPCIAQASYEVGPDPAPLPRRGQPPSAPTSFRRAQGISSSISPAIPRAGLRGWVWAASSQRRRHRGRGLSASSIAACLRREKDDGRELRHPPWRRTRIVPRETQSSMVRIRKNESSPFGRPGGDVLGGGVRPAVGDRIAPAASACR